MLKTAVFACIYFLHKLKSFRKISWGFEKLTSIFDNIPPGCDDIKIDLIIKKNGGWLVSFNISETKYATKNLKARSNEDES